MGTDGDSAGRDDRRGPPTAHRHGYTNRHPNGFWMLFGCLLVPLSMLTDGPFQLIQAHPTEFWMGCGIVSMLLGPTLDGRSEIKSIGVPFSHPMAKGISIGRSFCHILCHIAIVRAKCAQDSQKDNYSHPLCQRRGPIERRATASLERASSELFWLPYHRPSVRGLRTIQGHHLYWKVLCESSERYGSPEGGEQLDLHI